MRCFDNANSFSKGVDVNENGVKILVLTHTQ